ncbi:MAG: DUF484 family protein [Ideonella sp.]|jgi:hypothetical protein|nr:DUF484 family protein [Ideonella sp.]
MSPTAPLAGITEADIAEYLAQNPAFFERHAELLASVQLRSPHGARAVSLQERQAEMLRERHRGLEQRIVEMIRHGQENVAIADKLHRWIRAILLAERPADLPDILVGELQHQFLIPQAAVRLWNLDPAVARALEGQGCVQEVSADAKSFAHSLTMPYCGMNSGFEAASWLDEPRAVASMAMIPLRHAAAMRSPDGRDTYGLLVLASPDPTRYGSDMGVEFLMRIGETASAALSRLLPARESD